MDFCKFLKNHRCDLYLFNVHANSIFILPFPGEYTLTLKKDGADRVIKM